LSTACWLFDISLLPMKKNRSFIQWLFGLTLQKKLIFTFLCTSGIIVFLAINAEIAFVNAEKAVSAVLHNYRLLRLAKEGNINLARAGQLAAFIKNETVDVEIIEFQIAEIKRQFDNIRQEANGLELCEWEKKYVDSYLSIGKRFYRSLDELLSIKQEMMVHFTSYAGKVRPLYEILYERELAHVKFVQQLELSIEKNKPIRVGLNYKKCGFHKWLHSSKIEDEDIKEVLDELDPLHRKLHNFAGTINFLIENGNQEEALKQLKDTRKDLQRLGILFAGVGNFSFQTYRDAQERFESKQEQLNWIYEEAVKMVASFEEYLEYDCLQSGLKKLAQTSDRGKKIVWLVSLFGVAVSLVIGFYVAGKVGKAFVATKNSNVRLSLVNHQMKEEIERRVTVENELKLANEELEKMAITDGLTNLYNHRYMKKKFDSEYKRAKRYHLPLGFLMLDLDFFKKINDTYGHSCGDHILKEVSCLLKKRVRSSDVVARYGGEEMAIILPETDKKGAVCLAENIRKEIEQNIFSFDDSKIEVTVSIGVAFFSGEKNKNDIDLIKEADAALYRAKQNGRNQVVINE
jgi:diguanylate cyclase (GGDEF)-like protein